MPRFTAKLTPPMKMARSIHHKRRLIQWNMVDMRLYPQYVGKNVKIAAFVSGFLPAPKVHVFRWNETRKSGGSQCGR
jgi:hypothetical protein